MVVLLERGVAGSSNVKRLLPRAAEYISFQRRRFLISSLGTFNSCRPLAKLSKPGGGPGLLLFVFLVSLSRVTWVTKSTMLVPGMGTPLVINWPDALSHPSIPPGLLEIIFNRALALSGTPLGRALATGPITSSASSSLPSSSSPSSSDGGTDGRAVGKALCWSSRRAAVSCVSSFAVLYLRASSSAAAPCPQDGLRPRPIPAGGRWFCRLSDQTRPHRVGRDLAGLLPAPSSFSSSALSLKSSNSSSSSSLLPTP